MRNDLVRVLAVDREFNNSFAWAGIKDSFQAQWLEEGKLFRTEADARAALAQQAAPAAGSQL